MKDEVSGLNGNIFYIFISNWVIFLILGMLRILYIEY